VVYGDNVSMVVLKEVMVLDGEVVVVLEDEEVVLTDDVIS